MPVPSPQHTTHDQPPLLQWFSEQIETFAPPAAREQRYQLYARLNAMTPSLDTPSAEHIGLFVLAQIVAAHILAAHNGRRQAVRARNAHDTWYSQERRRIAKLLEQIHESPVVASFQATLRYYPAEDVTCPHGRNQKTCEALYSLQYTFHLFERYPPQPGVRKQIDRLRRREPHLPPLHDLCMPQGPAQGTGWDSAESMPLSSALPDEAVAPQAVYLLGTVVSRLRQAGQSVAQSCAYVDQILACCFDQPDPGGVRPALLVEQWRRLC